MSPTGCSAPPILRRGVTERERLLAEDAAVREALQRAVARLEVLAVAHRPLYAGSNVGGIDPIEMLRGATENEAEIISVSGWLLPVERAVALGLLVRAPLTRASRCPCFASRQGTKPMT
jgi:hypothetical protein